MAIAGLGMDLIELARIERVLARFGDTFLKHILSPGERRDLPAAKAARTAFVASRFAVKEAAAKALGTGFADGVLPADIETCKLPSGTPRLKLYGMAREKARSLDICACHLTLTHSSTHAAAVVILETAAHPSCLLD